ncbi:hypothetical protein F4779DRAFT_565597 [Xylariaceae sp. FL0662B]|nr:hypothetical protein F4779DRAFT_565597 [Xylariaceae sp. FL0662B]
MHAMVFSCIVVILPTYLQPKPHGPFSPSPSQPFLFLPLPRRPPRRFCTVPTYVADPESRTRGDVQTGRIAQHRSSRERRDRRRGEAVAGWLGRKRLLVM